MRARTSSVAFALALAVLLAFAPDADAKDEPRTEADTTPPPPPSSTAPAAAKPVVVWPTLTPAGDDTGTVSLHKPAASEGRVHARAQELDATLRDAVQDLGFTLDLADEGPSSGKTRDLDLLDRAAHSSPHGGPEDQGTWVLSARLEPLGGDQFVLRIVAVPPKGKQLRVRVEKVNGSDVSVRGLVLARDLLAIAPPYANEPGARPQE